MTRVRGRLCSENVTGLDFTGRPSEVEVTTFNAHPVSDLAPDAIPAEILHDLERAIVDHGWRHGVRSCTVSVTRTYKTAGGRRMGVTRMVGRLTYA